MVTVQQIIESGKVDESIDTPTLHDTMVTLAFQINGLKTAQFGAMGQARIVQHEKLLEKIQMMLNKRHGSDGMTHLTS